jgi:hypothetical protein
MDLNYLLLYLSYSYLINIKLFVSFSIGANLIIFNILYLLLLALCLFFSLIIVFLVLFRRLLERIFDANFQTPYRFVLNMLICPYFQNLEMGMKVC